MSLKKWVRIAIGILAGSGVVAILSGGALAASNGQDTASQNSQNLWIQQGNNDVQAPVAGQTSDVTQQNQYSVTTQSVSDNGPASVSDDKNGISGPGNAGSANQTNVQQGNGGTSTNGAQVPNSGVAKGSTSKTSSSVPATANGNQTGGQGQLVSSVKASTYNDTGAGIISQTSIGKSAVVPEVAVVAPVVQAADSDSKAVVRTTILPMQPVITNRATALAPDLAESMPTVPAPARAPVPAKSTGVLAGLVVGLSNVVIPQPVIPTDAVSLKLILGISLLTLVVLLANVFEFSYGQWLRRGGFATAARSDEPTDNFTSPFFATPLFSGYVEQPPRLHNPILLVLVPNAYRKEDRR